MFRKIYNKQRYTDSKNLNVPYLDAIGTIFYAAQLGRPDITFAMGDLSRKRTLEDFREYYKTSDGDRYNE